MANSNPITPTTKGKKWQRAPSPREMKFKELYHDPESPTFNNAYQSAMQAGYSHKYSLTITSARPHLVELPKDRHAKMLEKAEKNIDEFLSYEEEDIKKDKFLGKDKHKAKVDITKFVSERIGKDTYSTRQEVAHSGRGGTDEHQGEVLEVTFRKYLAPNSDNASVIEHHDTQTETAQEPETDDSAL